MDLVQLQLEILKEMEKQIRQTVPVYLPFRQSHEELSQSLKVTSTSFYLSLQINLKPAIIYRIGRNA
jgi:hypothetical protein